MNLYFLVEGTTESKVYPQWLSFLLPQFTRVDAPDRAQHNNYYLVSGHGYPSLLDVHLPNAIADVQAVGRYDHFLLMLDADEVSVPERLAEVDKKLAPHRPKLKHCAATVIVQNHCMETWFLGNRAIFTRNWANPDLAQFIKHYDVAAHDPEKMGKPAEFAESCAAYHYEYLRLLLAEKNVAYTKKYPRHVGDDKYIQRLKQRIAAAPEHLQTLQAFFAFCAKVA